MCVQLIRGYRNQKSSYLGQQGDPDVAQDAANILTLIWVVPLKIVTCKNSHSTLKLGHFAVLYFSNSTYKIIVKIDLF